jgi:DNA polymerase III sliding clamp (beta) subunit (PCNA family)
LTIVAACDWEISVCKFADRYFAPPSGIFANLAASKKHGAILHATDSDIGIRIRVDADVSQVGTVLVPAKRFIKILESAQDEKITMDETETGVFLMGSYNGVEFWELKTDSVDEFPDVENFTTESYHIGDSDVFIKVIRRVYA